MNKTIISILVITLCTTSALSQTVTKEYALYSNRGDSLFLIGEYDKAVVQYTKAFESNSGLAKVAHRYKAASCYSILNSVDSAFVQLEKIANKGKFSQVDLITADPNFKNLYK
jgi:tetratricopeptide (TPR) repeat protein